jgi:DNA repair exonuclease SbcCD ATPase subunit
MTTDDLGKIRAEIKDKLEVFASATSNPFPREGAIVRRQCEEFLVEMFAAAQATITALSQELQELNKIDRAMCVANQTHYEKWIAAEARLTALSAEKDDYKQKYLDCPALWCPYERQLKDAQTEVAEGARRLAQVTSALEQVREDLRHAVNICPTHDDLTDRVNDALSLLAEKLALNAPPKAE